jgi:hypothetical protein
VSRICCRITRRLLLCRLLLDCCLSCENPLYHFKGARSAPSRGWPPPMQERRATAALAVGRRSVRPELAGRYGDRDAPGRRLPSFGPSGHVGAGAHSPPWPTAQAARRNVSGGARCCKSGAIPPAPDPEALQDQPQGRSLRSRRSAQTLAPESCQGVRGRLSEGWRPPSAGCLCSSFL